MSRPIALHKWHACNSYSEINLHKMTMKSRFDEKGKKIKTYRLFCHIPSLSLEIISSLYNFSWEVKESNLTGNEIILIIDGPWGYALKKIKSEDPSKFIIVTDNPCCEYWEDVWDEKPLGLLTGGTTIAEISEAMDLAKEGSPFRRSPNIKTELSMGERKLLHFTATGIDNKNIAELLGLSEGTVKNGLNKIFQKLSLDNRTQAALYYWGLWNLLKDLNKMDLRG